MAMLKCRFNRFLNIFASLVIGTILLSASERLRAEVTWHGRNIESELARDNREYAVRLDTSRMAIAILSRDELLADAPRLSSMSFEELSRWLLTASGLVSGAQARQTVVNTPIPIIEDPTYRDRIINGVVIKERFTPPVDE